MKKIKVMILTILLVLGFALQSEIFHIECWNFNTGYYLSSTITYADEVERVNLITDLYASAQKNNVKLFSTNISVLNKIEYEMAVFADDSAKKYISQNHNMSEEKYYSVLSGNIDVKYNDFIDLTKEDNKYVNIISFIGDKADVVNVYKDLKEYYQLTYPKIMGANEKDMIFIMWGIIAMLMVIMTFIEVLYNKKEVVLRVSFGQDVKQLIFKSVMVEILVSLITFFVIKRIVFCFISGEYMKQTVLEIFLFGIVGSCLCYISYVFFNTRKIFSNIKESKEILTITYIVKAIITMTSMTVIVTNLSMAMNDIFVSNESRIVETCQGYSYISLIDEAIEIYYDEVGKRIANKLEYEKAIFKDYYGKAKPLICNIALVDPQSGISYICANEFAGGLLSDFAKEIEEQEAEVICFIPYQHNNENVLEYVEACMKNLINNTESIDVKKITYSGNKYITCVDNNATYGMKTVRNPVVIYSRYNGIVDINNISDSYFNNVLFSLTDEEVVEIEEKYKFSEKGYKIVKTSVEQNYEYYKNVVRRSIGFFSSICSFSIILQIVLVFVINKMEYQMNAMEIALKKILGYSIWKKNVRAVLISITYYIATVTILCIIGGYTQLFEVPLCIIIGTLMLIIEMLVILFSIINIEKKKVPKILKGGCL